MDNITIELLKKDEIDIIKEVETRQNINIISKENITKDFDSNTMFYYTLKLQNNIIGYIAFSLVIDTIEIESIVIDKFHQKKGYGTTLLNFTINFAKENNVSKIFLEVRKSNINAIKLYEKLGFEFLNIRKKYYTDTLEDALIYVKNLDI